MFNFPMHPMEQDCKLARQKPKMVWQILIFLAVFLISSLYSGIVVSVPAIYSAITTPGTDPEALLSTPSMTVLSLFATCATTGAALIYCLCIEKRSGLSMGFQMKTLWKSYGKGLLIGTGLIVLCSSLAWLMGALTLEVSNTLSPMYGLLYLLGFVIQGSSEEVLLRGYFMMSLTNRCSKAWAVGISSVTFSLLHLANLGFGLMPFLNITLFGVLMGLYVLREGDLWGACAIHSIWNFVQGNILGISVSGTGAAPTILSMGPVEGKALLSGGSFGIEGSLVVTVVLAAACAWTYFSKK